MHGHNYVLFVDVSAPDLDSVGRVIDFSCIKKILGDWIDEHWDHGFIAWCGDDAALAALGRFRLESGVDQKVYLMTTNPTAENMAKHLVKDICPALFADVGVKVVRAVLWETENCYATVTDEP
jgi:6-pyruvoyltetrahydropterin/6-carboxytetrahydropterin synthase